MVKVLTPLILISFSIKKKKRKASLIQKLNYYIPSPTLHLEMHNSYSYFGNAPGNISSGGGVRHIAQRFRATKSMWLRAMVSGV